MSEEKKKEINPQGVKPQSPLTGIPDTLNAGMKLLETFGIQKRDVGKVLIKTFVGGKIGDLLGDEKRERKSKFENLANGLKTIIWTVVGGIMCIILCKAFVAYFLGSGI